MKSTTLSSLVALISEYLTGGDLKNMWITGDSILQYQMSALGGVVRFDLAFLHCKLNWPALVQHFRHLQHFSLCVPVNGELNSFPVEQVRFDTLAPSLRSMNLDFENCLTVLYGPNSTISLKDILPNLTSLVLSNTSTHHPDHFESFTKNLPSGLLELQLPHIAQLPLPYLDLIPRSVTRLRMSLSEDHPEQVSLFLSRFRPVTELNGSDSPPSQSFDQVNAKSFLFSTRMEKLHLIHQFSHPSSFYPYLPNTLIDLTFTHQKCVTGDLHLLPRGLTRLEMCLADAFNTTQLLQLPRSLVHLRLLRHGSRRTIDLNLLDRFPPNLITLYGRAIEQEWPWQPARTIPALTPDFLGSLPRSLQTLPYDLITKIEPSKDILERLPRGLTDLGTLEWRGEDFVAEIALVLPPGLTKLNCPLQDSRVTSLLPKTLVCLKTTLTSMEDVDYSSVLEPLKTSFPFLRRLYIRNFTPRVLLLQKIMPDHGIEKLVLNHATTDDPLEADLIGNWTKKLRKLVVRAAPAPSVQWWTTLPPSLTELSWNSFARDVSLSNEHFSNLPQNLTILRMELPSRKLNGDISDCLDASFFRTLPPYLMLLASGGLRWDVRKVSVATLFEWMPSRLTHFQHDLRRDQQPALYGYTSEEAEELFGKLYLRYEVEE